MRILSPTKYELNVPALFNILSTGRPYNGRHESQLAEDWIDPIPGCIVDSTGNRLISIGENYRNAFSCHLDTVHNKDTRHQLAVVKDTCTIFNHDGGVLGADDGAGVWIMLMLIKYNVPGQYIFHVGEEMGGIGSDAIAEFNPELLEDIDMILAFDRKGTKDIITSQMTGVCCSQEWAYALAKQLDMGHSPATGSFTDTANYVHLVPECSNISIGYYEEHSKFEHLNVEYLVQLTDKLIDIKWHELPVKRNPSEDNYRYTYSYGSARDGFGYESQLPKTATTKSLPKPIRDRTRVEHLELIAELLKYESDAAAEYIYSTLGFDYDDFLSDLEEKCVMQYEWGFNQNTGGNI